MPQKQLHLLLNALAGAEQILILPHNNPDPDALASAIGLRYLLAQQLNVPVRVAYQGIIGRAENRALVRYLEPDLHRLNDVDLNQSAAIALVDTQPGAGNHPLPPETDIAVVLDHHPLRPESADAGFADIRPEAGATATIVTEYLQAAGIKPPPPLATGLFYGIKTDTLSLGRSAGQPDIAAYLYLQSHIDTKVLFEIERAQVPSVYFKSFAAALQAARIYKDVVIAYIGLMTYPDLVAEMADLLLRLEEIRWVICTGTYNAQLFLAVRSRSLNGGAGQLARKIMGRHGSAGGHGMMAGGQMPLDSADPVLITSQLGQAALEVLGIPPDTVGEPLV